MNRRKCVLSKKGIDINVLFLVEKGGVHFFMWKITVTPEYYLSFSWMARSKQTCLSSCNIKYIFNSNIDIFSQINTAFILFPIFYQFLDLILTFSSGLQSSQFIYSNALHTCKSSIFFFAFPSSFFTPAKIIQNKVFQFQMRVRVYRKSLKSLLMD